MTNGGGAIYRRVARNSAYLAGATVASAALSMLAVAVAARALSPREFGTLILLQSAALMVSMAMSFATQQPIIKLGADAQAGEDRDRLGELISRGLIIDAAASAIGLAIALLLIAILAGAVGLGGDDLNSARIFAFSLLFTGYSTSNGIFRLLDRFLLLGLLQALAAAALLAASAVLFLTDAPLEAFVWAWAGYAALNSQLQLWASLYLVRRKRIPLRIPERLFSGPDARVFLHYCSSTWMMSTVETLRTNGDSLLVGAAVSVEAAGLYNVAKQLAGMLRKLNTVYASALFPEISMLAASREIGRARRLKSRMMGVGLAIGLAAVAAVALVGRPLIELVFGAPFAGAWLPFVILTAAAAAQLVSHPPSMFVQVYRGPRRLLLVFLGAVATFVVAAVPLTFTLGTSGTALAQLLSALMMILLCQLALRRTALVGAADPRDR